MIIEIQTDQSETRNHTRSCTEPKTGGNSSSRIIILMFNISNQILTDYRSENNEILSSCLALDAEIKDDGWREVAKKGIEFEIERKRDCD